MVYQALLGFDGAEFHIVDEMPMLNGRRFDDLSDIFTDSCTVVGVLRPSEKSATPPYSSLVNPPADCVLQAGDQLVVVAEGSDSRFHWVKASQ